MNYNFFTFIVALTVFFNATNVLGQKKVRPYKCGFISKDLSELTNNYQNLARHLGVQNGEMVASVGASNGYVEVQISSFVDSVHWTLQDIDTACLNYKNLSQVIDYHEKLINRKLNGSFDIVIGSVSRTNLPSQSYDRILLVNVFHELSAKKPIMLDISNSLRDNGRVVIMERMATKSGQKHGDCGHPKLLESEFIHEMTSYGFELVTKVIPSKKAASTFYTFKKD
jgi:hypothetical protein